MTDPAAGPVPASPAPRGPTTAVPRPPGAFSLALGEFWTARRLPATPGVLAGCGVVGLGAAILLVGHRPGLGAAAIGLAVWLPAVPGLVRRRAVGDAVTAALAVALVAVVALRDAPWLVALCLATAVWVAATAATSARSAWPVLLSGLSWTLGGVRALPWLGRGVGELAGSRRGQMLVALRSVAVTIVLLVVFGLLFTSADPVFASYLPRIDLDLLPARVAVGLLIAVVAATLALLVLAPPGWSALRMRPRPVARLGEWLLPVAALDVMVLGFTLVQVGALAGGHRHVLETVGLSYAEYARAGFGQLVAVTALTVVVVGLAARRAPRADRRDRVVTSAALAVLCIGTLGVVASALRRMDLYVDAFGLTRLRLFVVVIEIALGVLLVLVLVAGARWRGGWLPRATVFVVGGAMLALAAVNPDALIARHNTTAPLAVPLDIGYLRGLSADAVPELERLDEPLRSCALRAVDVAPAGNVAEWNLGREAAASALAGRVITPALGSCVGIDPF